METSRLDPIRHMLDGMARVFLADFLILPTGVLTVAFLTRRLGPGGYGSFAIASAIILWIEATVNTIFHRPTLKLVADRKDWRPVGSAIAGLHLRVSLLATFILWLLAPSIGGLFHEETLATHLWLFSLDIPLSALAEAHRNLLVGIGGFRQRALSSAARWIGRLMLIVALVELGFSIEGAILGSIGASLFGLIVARIYVRPRLLSVPKVNLTGFWDYLWPLALFSTGVALFGRLDLFALKLLGGTANQAGIYAAAQALAVIPNIFAASFSALLLATLSRVVREGDLSQAKEIAADAMRLVILLLPFAGMTAGMSYEIVDFVFGPLFRPAAPLLALLIFGALGLVMISVITAILTAAGKPKWTFLPVVLLLPLAVVGHILLIPRFGPIGASAVTTSSAILGALGSIAAVYRAWQIFPPLSTVVRAMAVCGLAFVLTALWPASNGLLFFKIPTITISICGALFALREFGSSEIAIVRSVVQWRSGIRFNSN